MTFEYDNELRTHQAGPTNEIIDPPAMSPAGRTERLLTAWGAASTTISLMSKRYQAKWPGAIVALHDHRGTLEVTWRDETSRMHFEGIIVGAWERAGECLSVHRLAGA